jgi:ABC-2 type transport system permease protein
VKIIFKIAKAELRNLFYSPVAWFLAIAFLVQCAAYYTYAIFPYAKWQDVSQNNNPNWHDFGNPLTSIIFLKGNSIFSNVLQNLYLFVPLLTMGLISREVNNGTIRLLYSSPVKVRHIVMGKFLAILTYNLLLVLILGIFILTAAFNIRSVDYGLLLSAVVGFYLLVSAYTAIGMFMSSLSNYQIVSAIGSFIIIFILTQIGGLWQKYDFVRDLTYFLSMSGRTAKMLRGLITTKDVLYFFVIIYMFLGFSLIRLRSGRESRPWFIKAARYLAVFVSALTVGYIGSLPKLTGYWDTTARKVNTLHPNIQSIVKELGDDPLEITLYTNLLGAGMYRGLPESKNTYLSTVWERYVRFKPDIKFNYVYYYDLKKGENYYYKSFPHKNMRQIAEKIADGSETNFSLFIPGETLRKTVDLESENYRLVMQLKYKGRTTFLRTFEDPEFWPDDMQIAAAFKRLLQDTLPKVYFVTGDLERNIYKSGEREYKYHSIEHGNRLALVNIGFDADTISLDTQDIPSNASALVLADPKTRLSDTTMAKLKQFLSDGGNMFILGEPGKQQMLNPLLQQLGVQLMPGALVEPTKNEMPQMVRAYATAASTDLAGDPVLLRLKEAALEKDAEDSLKQLMPGVSALSYDSNGAFTIKPLLMTVGQRTWLKQAPFVTDSADIVYSPQEGDRKGSFPTALALTRLWHNKQQRIVVCGDADFISSARSGGAPLAVDLYSWLDYNKFPVFTPVSKPKDNKLLITPAVANLQIILFVWILPALVLIAGIILLIRRKSK